MKVMKALDLSSATKTEKVMDIAMAAMEILFLFVFLAACCLRVDKFDFLRQGRISEVTTCCDVLGRFGVTSILNDILCLFLAK